MIDIVYLKEIAARLGEEQKQYKYFDKEHKRLVEAQEHIITAIDILTNREYGDMTVSEVIEALKDEYEVLTKRNRDNKETLLHPTDRMREILKVLMHKYFTDGTEWHDYVNREEK